MKNIILTYLILLPILQVEVRNDPAADILAEAWQSALDTPPPQVVNRKSKPKLSRIILNFDYFDI